MNGEAYLSRRAWCLRVALCGRDKPPKRFEQIAFSDGWKITMADTFTWRQIPVDSLTKWDRIKAKMPRRMARWFSSASENIYPDSCMEWTLIIVKVRGFLPDTEVNLAVLEGEDPAEACRDFEQDWHNRKMWEAIL